VRWNLTAPESHVLIYGWVHSGEPLKLAFAELIARDVLRVVQAEEKPLPFGKRHPITVLAIGPNSDDSMPRPLNAALDAFLAAKSHKLADDLSVVAVDDLAWVIRKRYRWRGGYVRLEVMPTLIEKDLFRAERKRMLFLFPSADFVRTPSGHAATKDLEEWLSTIEESFSQMASADPERALRFVQQAGSAVLLMKDLHPQIRGLRESVPQTAGVSDLGFFPVTNSGESSDLPDIGAGVLNSLDSAFEAIASGFDVGGGNGGGGNGGGGEGGGI
jgi:hypothetical protein